ncbi:hypothetical protein AB0K62_08795 [Streptomyces halstedii]|uniref:hypothetical protein n=1 Tax=Streptomyces halstedii TaxID=1944 RepID=UPI003460498F
MAAPGWNVPPKKRATKKTKDQSDPTRGVPRTGLHPEIPGRCETPRCGAAADAQDETTVPTGWVRTGVYGSTDPDRIWCSGLCATYGVALAEVRAVPAQQEVTGA